MPDNLISSVRVEHGPMHDTVTIWNRGGFAGQLVVTKGDGDAIAKVLRPSQDDGPPRVHILKHGYALCGFAGIPSSWPEGHRWVAYNDTESFENVTCEGCLVAPAGAR